jgi:hypothetical protein
MILSIGKFDVMIVMTEVRSQLKSCQQVRHGVSHGLTSAQVSHGVQGVHDTATVKMYGPALACNAFIPAVPCRTCTA